MNMLKKDADLPIRSEYSTWAEFIELTGSQPSRLTELLDIGWLEPSRSSSQTYLFCSQDVYRIRKLERICTDFELPVHGGAIIVDLLERINRLEQQVRELANIAHKL